MRSRLELHESLKALLGSGYVYFQPPESVKMTYPCIVYELNNVDTKHANNRPYFNMKNYRITIIDKNPDSAIPELFTAMPLCRFDRSYTANNLNHWVFTLYY